MSIRIKVLVLSFTLMVVGAASAAFHPVDLTLGRNPGTVTISDLSKYKQVVAVSDVHGHHGHLKDLLAAAGLVDSKSNWSAGNTLLIVVGDSVDKGPDNLGVLDLWISLSAEAEAAGGKVIHLLGNHEAEFLGDFKVKDERPDPWELSDKKDSLVEELKDKGVPVSDLMGTSTSRGAFLHSEPVAARVGKWLFFHAGLFPASMDWESLTAAARRAFQAGAYDDPLFSNTDSLIEAKDWWDDDSTRASLERHLTSMGLFGIVFGHQPGAFHMKDKIGSIDDGRLIKIDSGMASSAGDNAGELLIFTNPEEMEEAAFPHAIVVHASGKKRQLVPETMPRL